MFMPHHPQPMIAVRYFLSFDAAWMAGAASDRPAAAEAARTCDD